VGKNADFLPCLFYWQFAQKNKLHFCIYFFEKNKKSVDMPPVE